MLINVFVFSTRPKGHTHSLGMQRNRLKQGSQPHDKSRAHPELLFPSEDFCLSCQFLTFFFFFKLIFFMFHDVSSDGVTAC